MTAGADVALHLPADASSAGAARRFLTATLASWGLADLEEAGCLLVSELVSNGLLHAGTELDVHLRRSGGRLRVEVHDRSSRLPERKYYSAASTTGRGLVLVSELSERWGAEPTAGGKVVWFELDEAAAPAAPPVMATGLTLEDWEDWDDLPPAALPEDGRPAAPAAPCGQQA